MYVGHTLDFQVGWTLTGVVCHGQTGLADRKGNHPSWGKEMGVHSLVAHTQEMEGTMGG